MDVMEMYVKRWKIGVIFIILGWQSGLCKAYIFFTYDHLRTETSSVQIILPTKVQIVICCENCSKYTPDLRLLVKGAMLWAKCDVFKTSFVESWRAIEIYAGNSFVIM